MSKHSTEGIIKSVKNKKGVHEMRLISGFSGRGKLMYSVNFWPESEDSVSIAFHLVMKKARELGYETIIDTDADPANYYIKCQYCQRLMPKDYEHNCITEEN